MVVDKWMLLRTKIIPTISLHKNITITKVIGGFVRTRQVPILCQYGTDLWLQTSIVYLAAIERRRRKLNETNDGHRVLLLLHGGVGKVLDGLLIPMKVTMEMKPSTDRTGRPVIQVFGTILQGMIFLNSITLLQMDRLQLTAVYCNRRRCKYHTSNDVFPRCKSCAVNGYR